MKNSPIRAAIALLLSLGLAACGGGDDSATTPAPASGGSGGSLTLSASAPTVHDGTLDLATATASGNNARAADGFSAVAYCELFWENVTSSNGAKYAVQVYFRQDDKQVIHSSVVDLTGWSVFSNNSGAPITGVTVDTGTRTLTYASKVLNGVATETTTVNGSTSFAPNATAAACGS